MVIAFCRKYAHDEALIKRRAQADIIFLLPHKVSFLVFKEIAFAVPAKSLASSSREGVSGKVGF